MPSAVPGDGLMMAHDGILTFAVVPTMKEGASRRLQWRLEVTCFGVRDSQNRNECGRGSSKSSQVAPPRNLAAAPRARQLATATGARAATLPMASTSPPGQATRIETRPQQPADRSGADWRTSGRIPGAAAPENPSWRPPAAQVPRPSSRDTDPWQSTSPVTVGGWARCRGMAGAEDSREHPPLALRRRTARWAPRTPYFCLCTRKLRGASAQLRDEADVAEASPSQCADQLCIFLRELSFLG